jgi:glycosyltransferase involved in cell wall biosynthesis
MDLSIIVPFVNEFPMIAFTLQSINQSLMGKGIEYEVIAIDNYCAEVKQQNRERDKSTDVVKSGAKHNDWLTYLAYDKKLSHWQAKNHGVRNSKGKVIWFCDGHCIAPYDLFKAYDYHVHHNFENSTHLPLTYKIMDSKRLVYKSVWTPHTSELHYTLSSHKPIGSPYEVPAMSTCGMMISRELYDRFGGWPSEFGIYGGGENFINYAFAVMGVKKMIYPSKSALHHHGEKRGYHWNYDDYLRNRFIAAYVYGGSDFADRVEKGSKGKPPVKREIMQNVKRTCYNHRQLIKSQQVMSIEEWIKSWQGREFFNTVEKKEAA